MQNLNNYQNFSIKSHSCTNPDQTKTKDNYLVDNFGVRTVDLTEDVSVRYEQNNQLEVGLYRFKVIFVD